MSTTPPPERAAPGGEVNILLVDDKPSNLLALRAVLEGLGHRLVEAPSGEEALRRLGEADYAVVLLDVLMPGLDGFETAKRIRAQENSRHTPIIFISAYDMPEFSPEQAYTLGAVDYLIKPFVPSILQAKVRELVALWQQTQEAKRQAKLLRLMIEGTQEYAILMLDP